MIFLKEGSRVLYGFMVCYGFMVYGVRVYMDLYGFIKVDETFLKESR